MAKAQTAARFVTEVAPPPVVAVMRRRKVPRSLDTIAEDDREQLAACGPASDHQGLAAAWSSRRAAPAPARERAGRLMRELSKSRHFLDAHGQQAGSGAWESGRKLGRRRVVRVQELHENCA
ncbi:LOW QUALITY PROTEIN: uncharacterized protein LOC120659487 [Panicum virgatum]|uniref:LOW QUALITY PROTEIN: uncharacterized protein LOC120659487 n=1 Tax=Panicum virgatum TaxID=38727 RepID=UPI0019D61087|nr:LOW QUALITY PROTEIN: uncharacterized protein LOC120659487 [Panicum virgatum]